MAQTFSLGELVEVEVEGVWFDAYVMEVGGKKYKVNYNNQSDAKDFWVKSTEIRKKAKSGDGSTSFEYEYNTGASESDMMKDDKKKGDDKDEKPSNVEVNMVVITLHNTCGKRAQMAVNDEIYPLEAHQKTEIEVPVGALVYTVNGGEKKIKGKVTVKLTTFYSECLGE